MSMPEKQTENDIYQQHEVGGSKALLNIFSKENRKKLIAIAIVMFFLFAALVYAFLSALSEPEEAALGGGSAVESGRVYHSENTGAPSLQEREATQQYNNNQLSKIQEVDQYAHPLVEIEDQGYERQEVFSASFDDEPEDDESDNDVPMTTSQFSNDNSVSSQDTYGITENDEININRLLVGLIEKESESPALYAKGWGTYYIPKRDSTGSALKTSGSSEDGEDQDDMSHHCKKPLARAASQFMATTDMALNSDVGGKFSVTIRGGGKLNGAKLMGSFERKEEYLRMEFDKMVTRTDTYQVDAIGLDIDSTLNAVEGQVNRHTLYRYGWWGVGSVLGAIGKAAEANANTSTYLAGNNGTVIQDTKRDSKREVKIAVGELGQDMGDVFKSRINRPITVKLNAGDSIGIFLLDDICQ